MRSPTDAQHSWRPDVLGPHFQRLTLDLEPDSEGEVVATLVRYHPAPLLDPVSPLAVAAGTDVLYVHGWSDYFFQGHLAKFWHRAGARFYALDLRKYGRSLRGHQRPGYVSDLTVYDEDIEAALTVIGHGVGQGERPFPRRLLVMGHSAGGLTLSLWAGRNPGRTSGVILNSPWLEFQAGGVGRAFLAPLVQLGARIQPLGVLPQVDLGFYTRSVSATADGTWEYDRMWRPERGFPAHPAWLSAVLAGQARVATGLGIDAPILTLLSARSTILPRWNPQMMTSDSVLVVEDIARRSLALGAIVTVARIDGALHDVMLSAPDVRRAAYAELGRWLRGYL